jgi:TRAP-type C4-dicarboxylate transport system substrate-binding protein
MRNGTLPLAAAALLAGGLLTGMARAEPLKFRVADVYPVGHTVSNTTIRVFMDEVKKRLGDQVEFEYYPAEQLGKGKDLLTLTQSGVVNIGLIVPSYVSDKLPLSAVSELPGSYKTSCQGTQVMHRLATGDGVLAKREFGPNGVHILITHSFAPFQAFSTKPYESLKSFNGQKLRTLGLVTDLTIKSMGGIPIRISAPEINEAMSRGTIDGGLMGVATVVSYDLIPYLKTATYGESFGGTVVAYAISEAAWKKLPPQVQQAMVEAGNAATLNGCKQADAAVEAQYDKLRAAGVKIIWLTPDDKAAFLQGTANIGREWADTLERRGKPARQVLEAFRAALAGS